VSWGHCAGMPQRERIAGVLVGASAIHPLLRLGEGSVRHKTAIGFVLGLPLTSRIQRMTPKPTTGPGDSTAG
jgi:hypothetical protein